MSIIPRLKFDEKILSDLFSIDDPDTYEMALASYLHKNPFVRIIVAWRMQIALRFLGNYDDKKILDYGCGLGILFLQFIPSKAMLYGTDINIAPASKTLKAHNRSDIDLLLVRTLENDIESNTFDTIISLEVLEHVDDLRATILLLKDKLKKDGKFIISGPTENRFYGLLRRIAGFTGEYHHRDIYQIVSEIENVGFRITKKRVIPLPKPFDVFIIYELIQEDS
jgi:2-polyprenyl-3-methyl-5-hydroxy-6-metoxy-1,4-benzoquinol methylase